MPDLATTTLEQGDGASVPNISVVLLGCGKMGMAMLDGWLAAGLAGRNVAIIEPSPSAELTAAASEVGASLLTPDAAAIEALSADLIILAVKPQMMAAALPSVAALAGPETPVLSVAAGLSIAYFEAALPSGAPIIRAMPNTPAAVRRGITALIANSAATEPQRATAEQFLGVVGETLWLDSEAQMDAVTGLSGSGPAYVFHMIEALTEAGIAQGLPPAMAERLARATVCGAGALAAAAPEPAATLRENVTSPGGTTAAGLAELMDHETGLGPLLRRTVAAAADRSRELAG